MSLNDVNLVNSSEKDSWESFVIIMYIFWILSIFLSTLFLQNTNLWKAKLRRKPGNFLKLIVLGLNEIVAVLRVIYFVDPRGWNGYYQSITYELLLRIPICLQLAQWLIIILRWRDLELFTGSQGLNKMMRWTPQNWTRITIGVIGVLSLLILLFTCLAENGISKNTLSNAINTLLGIYAGVFVIGGTYVGARTSIRLFTYKSSAAVDEKSGTSKVQNISQGKAKQIFGIMIIAIPLTLLTIAVTIWRGNRDLNPKDFLAYLVIRHIVEVVMCYLVYHAVIDAPLKDLFVATKKVRESVVKHRTQTSNQPVVAVNLKQPK
eukprot:c16353_g1_i1.p1 GENE.c16353_g1_i1~~c16353_g1_i1.p1  ORF type:complete len:320 (+),score=100.65 c16353_g1_i1:20-979(+)